MPSDVIVRPAARLDVRKAAFWYEHERLGLGVAFTLEFDALVDRIAQNPLQYHEIEPGVRRALLRGRATDKVTVAFVKGPAKRAITPFGFAQDMLREPQGERFPAGFVDFLPRSP